LPADLKPALCYIGSKGLNLELAASETGKKPYIHGKIMKWTKLCDVSDILKQFLLVVAEELTNDQGYNDKLRRELYTS
jgi:hypothetical protein